MWRSPISRRFGREPPILYETHKDFDENLEYFLQQQNPCLIKLPDKTHTKPIDYQNTVRNIIGSINSKSSEVEVMISQNKEFDNQTVCSKIMPLEEFLMYDGSLNLYIAQFPMFQKFKENQFYNISQKEKLKKTLS